MFDGPLFAFPFSNNSCVDIAYSPPARYKGWAGAGDGTIQHLEFIKNNQFRRKALERTCCAHYVNVKMSIYP